MVKTVCILFLLVLANSGEVVIHKDLFDVLSFRILTSFFSKSLSLFQPSV